MVFHTRKCTRSPSMPFFTTESRRIPLLSAHCCHDYRTATRSGSLTLNAVLREQRWIRTNLSTRALIRWPTRALLTLKAITLLGSWCPGIPLSEKPESCAFSCSPKCQAHAGISGEKRSACVDASDHPGYVQALVRGAASRRILFWTRRTRVVDFVWNCLLWKTSSETVSCGRWC